MRDKQLLAVDKDGNLTGGHLAAFKAFCRWMVKERRASESPVSHLCGLNARTDRRIERRALTSDECRKLLAAAQEGVTLYNMTGPDRAMLYRVALETGLRWSELRSLTVGSFALDAVTPTVSVQAAYSKHRRDDTLPLRHETAAALKACLANHLPGVRAFPMPDRRVGGDIIREDLVKASIGEANASGRVIDFHGLRHTFIGNLAAGGVHPKTAQTLARHSSITLTMDRYTHLSVADQTAALDALPDLDKPADEALRATGTDDAAAVSPSVVASCLASERPQQVVLVSGAQRRKEAAGQDATSSRALRSEGKSSRIAPSARVAELADALDLGSSGEILAGSTPAPRTCADPAEGACCLATARFAAHNPAPGAFAWTGSADPDGSFTRHATNSETTHKATPESVKVGR
jgi:integrase